MKVKEVLTFDQEVNCNKCHNVVNPVLIKYTKWQFILLLIIPILFPSSIDYYVVCPICNYEFIKLKNSEARKIIKETRTR